MKRFFQQIIIATVKHQLKKRMNRLMIVNYREK